MDEARNRITMKKPKQINLSEQAIETLTIAGVKSEHKNFKRFVENHLELLAVRLGAVRQKSKK